MKLPIREALDDFLEDCRNHQKKVFVKREALKGARKLLVFERESHLLDFLGSDYVKNLRYKNTKPPEIVYMPGVTEVHAWIFDSPQILGDVYIAFGLSRTTGMWTLKSFHEATANRPVLVLGENVNPESEE